MAEAKTSGANTSQKEKASKKTSEPVYSAEELSNAASRFGTRKECVAAALEILRQRPSDSERGERAC